MPGKNRWYSALNASELPCRARSSRRSMASIDDSWPPWEKIGLIAKKLHVARLRLRVSRLIVPKREIHVQKSTIFPKKGESRNPKRATCNFPCEHRKSRTVFAHLPVTQFGVPLSLLKKRKDT